jgi:hypothetical protein
MENSQERRLIIDKFGHDKTLRRHLSLNSKEKKFANRV